jgi:hypothetical protein
VTKDIVVNCSVPLTVGTPDISAGRAGRRTTPSATGGRCWTSPRTAMPD